MSGFDSRVLETAKQIGTSLGLRVTGTLEKPARLAAFRELLERLGRPHEPRAARPAPQPPSAPPDDPITVQQIYRAMIEREFQLHLQPIVTAKRYAVCRLEALLRWVHPAMGMVPPLRFIPVAEQDQGLMNSLTSWVIETALDHYQALSREGFSLPIAVNISALDLRSTEFPDRVAALMSARGLPIDALSLEVTESVIMQDTVRTSEILSRLRLKGIGIAIDDLGTGYSSLSSLRQMPFSEMKIDATFVRDVIVSREARAIVKSLLDLSHSMAIGSVAEGVETEEVAQELIDMGVDYLQGYHFSRPLSMDQLKAWLPARPIRFESGAHTPA
jgi:EAL domain-containing protein (putative c-di-GMP-specific phosphodiesterase class I)